LSLRSCASRGVDALFGLQHGHLTVGEADINQCRGERIIQRIMPGRQRDIEVTTNGFHADVVIGIRKQALEFALINITDFNQRIGQWKAKILARVTIKNAFIVTDMVTN
jgi:hypothetical protein